MKFTLQINIKIAPNPFDHGNERVAFYGLDYDEGHGEFEPDYIVLKEYKRVNKTASSYEASAEIQTIAAYLANEFTIALEDSKEAIEQATKMEFIGVKNVSTTNPDGSTRNMSLEQYFPEDFNFIRFSNNAGFQLTVEEAQKNGISSDFVDFVMAFSHWTYKVSVDL